jgi:hypothetical protein
MVVDPLLLYAHQSKCIQTNPAKQNTSINYPLFLLPLQTWPVKHNISNKRFTTTKTILLVCRGGKLEQS